MEDDFWCHHLNNQQPTSALPEWLCVNSHMTVLQGSAASRHGFLTTVVVEFCVLCGNAWPQTGLEDGMTE